MLQEISGFIKPASTGSFLIFLTDSFINIEESNLTRKVIASK